MLLKVKSIISKITGTNHKIERNNMFRNLQFWREKTQSSLLEDSSWGLDEFMTWLVGFQIKCDLNKKCSFHYYCTDETKIAVTIGEVELDEWEKIQDLPVLSNVEFK